MVNYDQILPPRAMVIEGPMGQVTVVLADHMTHAINAIDHCCILSLQTNQIAPRRTISISIISNYK